MQASHFYEIRIPTSLAAGLPVNEMLPIPMTAAEVLIGPGDVDRIMMGGGFHRHGGSDSLRYFTHADDGGWALVFSHDCDGNPTRGAEVAASYSPNAAYQPRSGGGCVE